jgi:ABC-type polysaccharide/polyol phosphate transport system ATPase subunit
MGDIAVEVEGVSKRFRLYHERNQSLKAAFMRGRRAKFDEFWALRDVGFSVPAGKTYGLIGHNGSGKSTMLKCMAGILVPDRGSLRTRGKISALLELGAGFHPELSGRDNVYLNGSILGMSKKQIDAQFDEIVDFAGLETFIDTPVKNYSSGMYVRLGFSVAINVDPEVLMVDEVLAVGDEAFQRKCMDKFKQFRDEGRTVIIVSHALGTMRTMCDEVAWLDHGRLLGTGRPGDLVDQYTAASHEHDESAADTFSVGPRWGSGEVRIDQVEMLDEDDKPLTMTRTGDAVTFRMHYRAKERLERPVFGFGLHTADGQHVTGPNTRDVEMIPDFVEGQGHVDFRVPRLMLVPGAFDVSVSVFDYACLHPYDFWTRALRFDVEVGTPHELYGVVSLGGSWAVPGCEEHR